MVELFNVHSSPVGLAEFVAGGWRLVGSAPSSLYDGIIEDVRCLVAFASSQSLMCDKLAESLK